MMDHPLNTMHHDLSDLAALGAGELAFAIRSGALSPLALAEACLDRIARHDNVPHSFITVTTERPPGAARTPEAKTKAGQYRGPFHGIPGDQNLPIAMQIAAAPILRPGVSA
jgi:hypothetical protein